MTQQELKGKMRTWIYKQEFEQVEYFVLETILENYLKEKENKRLTDIENWEKIRSLILHEDKENQVLGLQLLEGKISKKVRLFLEVLLNGNEYLAISKIKQGIIIRIETEIKIGERIMFLEKEMTTIKDKIKQTSFLNLKDKKRLQMEYDEKNEECMTISDELFRADNPIRSSNDKMVKKMMKLFHQYHIDLSKIRF